ncbi:hypothetical protein [Microbulbifer epialgicus]|uniref:Uncharacterized protein n=1 Tax=Microbulbifer epialgicus TaxID=393907 RepID=A0ABV4NZ15_9GAMM
MRPSGKFTLPLLSVLAIQGCLFLPAEEVEGEDPFFFEADTVEQGESFVDAGNYHSQLLQPASASLECKMDCVDSVYDSTSWFFPILRVY